MRQEQHDAASRAERTLLAGVFRGPDALDEVAHTLCEDHFREHNHRLVWRAVQSLYAAGARVEVVGVAEWLTEAGLLARLDIPSWSNGYAWLAELAEEQSTGANVPQHARIVRDHALLRSLYHAGQRISMLAVESPGPAREMLEAAEREIFALAEHGTEAAVVTWREACSAALQRLDQRMVADRLPGVPSGIADLDRLTAGWQPSELVVLAARPSVGKTSAALAMARHAAGAGHPVLVASIEQAQHELAARLLVAESGVSGSLVRQATLTPGEQQRLLLAQQALSPLPGWIDDAGEQSVLRIAANARRLKRQQGLALVVVDYLQLVCPDDRHLPRHEQVAGISRRLKALARELSIPVIACAQLNRASEDRAGQKPRLADLRESGGIEADSDVVVLLHRPPEEQHYLNLIVAKNRNGPVGDVCVRFDRERMRFGDVDGPF